MSRLNKVVATEWLKDHDKSVHWLHAKTDIPVPTLKGAIWCGQQMRDGRIRALAKVMGLEWIALVAEEKPPEPKPEPKPPPQPKVEPVAPPKRQNGRGTRPPRADRGTAA